MGFQLIVQLLQCTIGKSYSMTGLRQRSSCRKGYFIVQSRWLSVRGEAADVKRRISSSSNATPSRIPARTISKFSSVAGSSSENLNLAVPTYIVWGANTGVGKTLASAALAGSALSKAGRALYLKPVQTGFPEDDDAAYVKTLGEKSASRHGCSIKELDSTGLWKYKEPISPHRAAMLAGSAPSDEETIEAILQKLARWKPHQADKCLALIETAGGVASPGASGRLQCDIYRSLRLPGILVGDGRLGGISCTVSAYESLLLRGYDAPVVIMADHGHENHEAVQKALGDKVSVWALPCLPEHKVYPKDVNVPEETFLAIHGVTRLQKPALDWILQSRPVFDQVLDRLRSAHAARLHSLQSAGAEARKLIWWPFTQHKMVGPSEVTVIDSRCGEDFVVFKEAQMQTGAKLVKQFDACASWWTQGVGLEEQADLSRAVAYAAGRYGHVMFPENVHEPALALTKHLLHSVGQNWASRVFFSDNGATAVEVALKMAFRKFVKDHDLTDKTPKLQVLGLEGSYHGDTLGAMEAQAPSPYTGPLQQPWYSGRGAFLSPPSMFLKGGRWVVQLPEQEALREASSEPERLVAHHYSTVSTECKSSSWQTRDEALDVPSRQLSKLATAYSSYIQACLDKPSDAKIGALLIETVLHGAGGMVLIDPLFQHILVLECRKRRIPVIYDEVFSGFWRLGVQAPGVTRLGLEPDIACYAKLLTGGIVPLAVTLASKEVFQAFEGDSKLLALLHGHSYTAHAIGCGAANAAQELYKRFPASSVSRDKSGSRQHWDDETVNEVSSLENVERVVALGTVFAVELKVAGGGGYGSNATRELILRLREKGVYARPLGPVIYFMCTPFTKPDRCKQLLRVLMDELRRDASSLGRVNKS